MKIKSLFVLLLFVLPSVAQPPSNKNAFIELPPDMEISSRQRSVKITAKTDAKDLQWLILNTGVDEKGKPLAVQWDDVGGNSIRVFPNDVDDEILVICYGTSGMPAKATPPVAMGILVVGPAGRAKKDGGEPAEPVVEPKRSGKIAAHVSFVVDFQKQTADVAAILNDANLRGWVMATGARLHAPIDVKSEVVQRAKGGLLASVMAAGGPPCVIVQDIQGNVIGSGRMLSVQAVKDTVSPHVK